MLLTDAQGKSVEVDWTANRRSIAHGRFYLPSWDSVPDWDAGDYDNPEMYLPCVWCGEQAQSVDHMTPYSFIAAITGGGVLDVSRVWTWLVPACLECNRAATDDVFLTPRHKRDAVRDRLGARHFIESSWTPDEIEELGYNLRTYVKARQEESIAAIRRLRFNGSLPPSVGSRDLVRLLSGRLAPGA